MNLRWNYDCLEESLTEDKWRGGSSDRALEEAMLTSYMVGPSVPQHTLRRRLPHILPTCENSADDMDNLDDVSQFSFVD